MDNYFKIPTETLAKCNEFDVSIFSDAYKDAYGFRPRMPLGHMSAEQLDALWRSTIDAVHEAIEADKSREADALAALESLLAGAESPRDTLIAKLGELGCDEDEARMDPGYACYHLGLAYAEERRIKEILGD